jgi:hypothetical protein
MEEEAVIRGALDIALAPQGVDTAAGDAHVA